MAIATSLPNSPEPQSRILVALLFYSLININLAFCQSKIIGKVNHDDLIYKNKIIDSKTQQPLSGAKISVPEIHYTTYTDKNGTFQLNADITNKTVLFVEKEGYKVFSLTIDNNIIRNPLKLGIEQSSPFDLQITDGIIHLGDDMFSDNSANSKDFRQGANGHYYSYLFSKPKYCSKQDVVIKFGTIIGLDTKKAKMIGQNKIAKVYSSPTEVFVNGNRIGILEINGDNQEIIIPKSLLKEKNELVIKTGRNLFQTEYIDYDDIELANIRVEIEERQQFARY